MNLSLGPVLAVCLAGLQFIAVLTVVTTSYLTSERALLLHARTLLSDVAHATVEHSRVFLKPAESATDFAKRLAENDIVASNDKERLEKLLFQQLATTPEFAGVFYGDTMGNFVFVKHGEEADRFRSKIIEWNGEERRTDIIWRDGDFAVIEATDDPTDTYDPRTRPWYKEVEKQRRTIWTDPYIFFTSQKPGITVAAPVTDNMGKLIGVIGVDIDIDAISDFLSRQNIGEGGKAIILNHNGDVIAHPNSELIKTKDADGSLRFSGIDEIEDPVIRAAFGHLKATDGSMVEEETSSAFIFEGREYVSNLVPTMTEGLPWTIGVVAPEDDFIGSIKTNRAQNIGVAALIALLTGMLGLLLARFITRPVRALAERAAMISQGNINEASGNIPLAFSELETANDTINREVARRKKSEKEQSVMFELDSRGVAEVDTVTGELLRTNSAFAKIFGYENGDVPVAEQREIAKLINMEPGSNVEMQYACMNGKKVWILATAFRFNDADTGAARSLVTLNDITDAKTSARKVRELNREITHGDRLTTMGQMAAGLAHELNQPLTAITQNVDAAKISAETYAEDDPELLEILQEIDLQAHRSGDIIRALRDFIRKDESNIESFDIGELISQTMLLVDAEAREQGVTISGHHENLPLVRGVRVQIAQVFVNLLRNGIEAISAADPQSRNITINAEQDENEIGVTVTDTGPGADPSVDLFTEFQTTKKNGMGLGLSICRNIIEAHGGQLRYEKASTGGSSFSFTLPMGDAV